VRLSASARAQERNGRVVKARTEQRGSDRVRVLICPEGGHARDGVCLDGRVARVDIRGVAIAFAPMDSIERKRLRRIMDTDGEAPSGGA